MLRQKKNPKSNLEERILDIGLAYEEIDKVRFAVVVNKANQSLKQYGIRLRLDECVEIELPEYDSKEDLTDFKIDFDYAVRHSFSRPQDYFFAWSNAEHASALSLYSPKRTNGKRSCLIGNDSSEEDIEACVKNEVIALFSEGTMELGMIKDNLSKEFKRAPYDLNKPITPERIVTVNIGLDDVYEKMARDIMKVVSKIYKKNFGISFNILRVDNLDIPDEWNNDICLEKVRAAPKHPSDIYLLFTKKPSKEGTLGMAYHYTGACWVNTDNYLRNVVHTTAHEIGHLFDADHVYKKYSMMHPYNNDMLETWTPRTREIILQNRRKRWKWSNHIYVVN